MDFQSFIFIGVVASGINHVIQKKDEFNLVIGRDKSKIFNELGNSKHSIVKVGAFGSKNIRDEFCAENSLLSKACMSSIYYTTTFVLYAVICIGEVR
jgi:hypothetical protein